MVAKDPYLGQKGQAEVHKTTYKSHGTVMVMVRYKDSL